MKIVDLKNCKQIPKKYHYMIDWEATYHLGVEKDVDGYWIYLKPELAEDPKGQHLIHEPLTEIKFYLEEAHEQIQKTGKFYLNY